MPRTLNGPARRLTRTARLTILAALTAGLVLYVGLAVWSAALAPEVAPRERWPAGRWHRLAPVRGGPAPEPEELARFLSLPYAAGTRPATSSFGVVRHEKGAAAPGVNLYVSGHGPEAFLMDLEGKILHRWRLPFERAFPGRRPTLETSFWRRAHRLPGDGLLAIFQGAGVIRLDAASRLVWASPAGFYNDLFVGPDGRIHGLTKRAVLDPALDAGAPILEDFYTVLAPDGRELERLSLLDAFRASAYASLLEPMRHAGDIFHTNTIEVFDGGAAAVSPLLRAGNVLLSLREVDIVAILDPEARRIVWAKRGPWRAQHQPTLLPGGRILLFDNRGGGGHSRVLEYDLVADHIVWEYGGPPGDPLDSPQAGSVQRLPNGDTLITESERGRALEIAPDGRVVWEFVSPHRTGQHQELVATLFEVERLPAARR